MTSSVEFDPVEEPAGQPSDRPSGRIRRIGVAGGAAAALLLAAGGVAWADSGSANTSATGYGSAPTGAPPSGSSPSGAPSGAPTGRPAVKHIPTIDGTVTSVSGTSILVKDFDGFTRTIVTSSKTVYKNGLTADPKVGTHLHAEGTVDANHTSLDATLITTAPAGGPGHPGGGPGGPGGGPGGGWRGAPAGKNGQPPAAGKAPSSSSSSSSATA